jgi:hypothetical protein
MTLNQAKHQLRALGITLRSMPEYGEYRVNFANGNEATACYETDLQAAVDTGIAMSKEAHPADLRSTYGEDMRRGELSDDLGESPDY